MSRDRFGYPITGDEDVVTGDVQMICVLAWLEKRIPAVVSGGVSAAVRQIERGVKSGISVPSVRRTIGSRFVAVNAAEVEAKIGASVGVGSSSFVSGQRGNRPGVGIDSRNVHWWFLGTKSRTTSNGRYTGRMPATADPISVLVERAGGVHVLRHFLSERLVHEFEAVQ